MKTLSPASASPPQPASNKVHVVKPASPEISRDLRQVYAQETGTLIWAEHELMQMAGIVEKAIASADGPPIFQRALRLVRMAEKPPSSCRGLVAEGDRLVIIPVDWSYLRAVMAENISIRREDRRTGKMQSIAPPKPLVDTSMSRQGYWPYPELRGLIFTPTLRHDLSILQTPGYDPVTQVYYNPGDTAFPPIPERPTAEDVVVSREIIDELLTDFPFVAACDKSVFLAALLTVLVRHCFPIVPAFGFTSPGPSMGKTTAAQVCGIVATGNAPPVMQYPAGDETEVQKILLSVLSQGLPLCLIDNVEKTLRSPAICSLLTSEAYSGRLLGVSTMATLPNTLTILATGVNLRIGGDLTSRTLVCRLDPHLENPAERAFSHEIFSYAIERRAQIVWAMLVMLRAFISAGAPACCSTWNRFPAWSNLVRGAIVHLGYADPLETQRRIEQEDPDRLAHVAVIAAWQSCLDEGGEYRVKEIIERCNPVNQELRDAIHAVAGERGEVNARRLGWWLANHADRIQDGQVIRRARVQAGQALWRLEHA